MERIERLAVAKRILGFLRGIDWSTSTDEWKHERIADILIGMDTILDVEAVSCPREQSDMTPCVFRDGPLAMTDDQRCAGCSEFAHAVYPNR